MVSCFWKRPQCLAVIVVVMLVWGGSALAKPAKKWVISTDDDPFTPAMTIINDQPRPLPKTQSPASSLLAQPLPTTSLQTLEYRPPSPSEPVTTPVEPSPPPTEPAMSQTSSVAPGAEPGPPVQETGLAPAPPAEAPKAMPTFAVFPVMNHPSSNKAFSDFPLLLSTAVANQLSQRATRRGLGVSVLNPVYAYDALREKGLLDVYHRMMADYVQAGEPNERDMTYLADQLSTPDQHIDWVVFVQAEFDVNHMASPHGVLERPMRWFYGNVPVDPNYALKGNVQVFSTADGMPLVWQQSTRSVIRLSQFNNFSRSIQDDSDSMMNFRRATSSMATALVVTMPTQILMNQSLVQARILHDPVTTLPVKVQQNVHTLLEKLH